MCREAGEATPKRVARPRRPLGQANRICLDGTRYDVALPAHHWTNFTRRAQKRFGGCGTDIDFEVLVKTRAWPALLVLIATCSTGCATVARKPAVAAPAPQQSTSRGLASYYGNEFDGKHTASGIPFDMNAMVAAHPNLPFGTVVRVTNLKNGRSADVRIVDRGPAQGPRAEGVIIDVSRAAARALDFIREGRVPVRLVVLRSKTASQEVSVVDRR